MLDAFDHLGLAEIAKTLCGCAHAPSSATCQSWHPQDHPLTRYMPKTPYRRKRGRSVHLRRLSLLLLLSVYLSFVMMLWCIIAMWMAHIWWMVTPDKVSAISPKEKWSKTSKINSIRRGVTMGGQLDRTSGCHV